MRLPVWKPSVTAYLEEAQFLLFISPLRGTTGTSEGNRQMVKILVLDDVLDAVTLLKRILEKKGYQVFGFTEEEEAIDHVKGNKVNLAILDIKLKKISGVDVLAEMKKIDPDIGVIMLTGYPTLESARESLKLGASEYCVKPIDKDEIEEKVEKVLGSKT
jgi:DNA-binding NtrC family response regulator